MESKKLFTGGINTPIDKSSQYYRTYEASPIFSFLNGSMATTTSWLIDLETMAPVGLTAGDVKKFLPLTNLTITNNSAEDIYVYINQTPNAKIIPAGNIISFSKGTIPAIRSLKIYNASANTIYADKIEISVYKEGVVIDDAYRKFHKALFGVLYSWRR